MSPVKELNEHERRIKEIFRNIYRTQVWVSIEELEDIRTPQELEERRMVAKLNVMTMDMLEYDESYFREDSDQRPAGYRPYFYSYLIYMDAQSDHRKLVKLREMGTRWFIAEFRRRYSEGWDEYEGTVESSASPVIFRDRKIYISDTTLNPAILRRIHAGYPVAKASDDKVAGEHLKILLEDVHFTSTRIYNVGNGNLICLSGNRLRNRLGNRLGNLPGDSFKMMFDVGYHQRSHPGGSRTKYGAAVRSFKKVIPDAVVFSHWDNDHIMGCVYAPKELFECPWIAPEIVKKNAVGAKRLAAYLTVKDKLTIVRRDSVDRKLVEIKNPDSEITFYVGANKQYILSKENCGGILIEIKNRKNGKRTESLFSGDAPYKAVKNVVWAPRTEGYDNLIVPHHGSNMDFSALKVKKDAAAIVCGDRTTGRPCASHKKELESGKSGYKVTITGEMTHFCKDLDLG